MQSLHTRLDPIKDEVLRILETFGDLYTMNKYQVYDFVCFRNWVKETTGNENYGINPKIILDGHQTMGFQLAQAFIRTVVDLKAKLKERDERIAFLEFQLSQGSEKDELQALAVLQVCEVK